MPPPTKPIKPYFFYGHRKPSLNRPTVYGGLFSNRQTLNPKTPNPQFQKPTNFTLKNWYPDAQNCTKPSLSTYPHDNFLQICQKLSPIARFICDSFRKHRKWGPPVMADLGKLRRVLPDVVAEVVKVQVDPAMASRFFHWAGKQKGYKHNFASYNAFAYCLNRLNRFRAAEQLPELMQMQGRPPTEKQFEILIRSHADNGRGLRVYYVYEKMKKFGITPRIFLYNRIMDALVKTGHLDLAMSVYDEFRSNGLVEESVTYMILIKGLCKEGRIDEMLELLGRMRSLCKPDIFAYTAMVKVLVAEGNLDGCLTVWGEMKRDDVEPDVMAYATIISALCKGKRVETAYELFKEMKERGYLIDRAIYGSLIEAFVNHGKVGLGFDLLKDLMDSGYRADLTIYNCLIKGLCDVKRVDRAFKLFQRTVEEGLQSEFETVNPILVSYAKSSKMDEFYSLLSHMQKLGLPVIDDLSNFFWLLVEKEDGLTLALEVFQNLKTKGYLSVSIYNVLIGSVYINGDAKKALSLFNEIKDSNFEPDSVTYSHAILCLVELKDVQEGCLLYNKIKDMGSVPSVDAYSSLVRGLCKLGEIDAAILLVRDCLANVASSPMEFKYTLTILHTCKSNDAEKVLEVISEMIEEGSKLDDIICCAIISGMCKHGTIEEARKVFSSMKERKLMTEANVIVYEEMLIEHAKKKTADLVLSGLKFFGLESKLKANGSTLLSS